VRLQGRRGQALQITMLIIPRRQTGQADETPSWEIGSKNK